VRGGTGFSRCLDRSPHLCPRGQAIVLCGLPPLLLAWPYSTATGNLVPVQGASALMTCPNPFVWRPPPRLLEFLDSRILEFLLLTYFAATFIAIACLLASVWHALFMAADCSLKLAPCNIKPLFMVALPRLKLAIPR
jgi:hypothetical protein